MKRLIGLILSLCFVLLVAGCASKPPASSGMPISVANARRTAADDVLVGVGTAKLSSAGQSRSLAATRARTEISNTMNNIIKNMATDYWASSEVDPQAQLSYAENITVSLSKSELSGAVIWEEQREKDGTWWCVVHLSKGNVVKEITQAQAQARLAVPAAASLDATARMDEMFDRAKKEGW